jgi:hypothetical protein
MRVYRRGTPRQTAKDEPKRFCVDRVRVAEAERSLVRHAWLELR